MGAQGDESEEPLVLRIAEQTHRLIEARRKKENARKMARLMRNFNYDLLRGGATGGSCDSDSDNPGSVVGGEGLELDEAEAERVRRLREVEEEVAAMATAREAQPNKYESPMIVQLRGIETVDAMYHLADKIIPLASLKR